MTKRTTKSEKYISLHILLTVAAVIAIAAALVVFALNNKESSDSLGRSGDCIEVTTYTGERAKRCAEDYVGMKSEKAKQKAKNDGLIPVVAKGEGVNAIMDVGGPVMYFEIEDGVVTHAYTYHIRNKKESL